MNLQEKVDEVPYWYHRIDLPDGVKTYGDTCGSKSPGWAPMSAEMYRIPMDLYGKRILDVGAWDGYWTFEALRRGAKEVVAIDDFSDIVNFRDPKQFPPWHTFDLCREAFGYSADQCSRMELSTYEVREGRLGRFDYVFFFGVLYHCRYPLMALDRACAVCDETIFVETAICDDFSAHRKDGRGFAKNTVMEFYPGSQYADNATNWWAPTIQCAGAMLRAAGCERVWGWKLVDEPTHIVQCRGFLRGDMNV